MTFLIIFENYLILNNFENDFSHHIRELPTSQQLREWLFSSYARNVSSNCLPQTRHNHIGCIYLIFLHCVFSNVSSNHLHEMRHNHIGCICLTFPQCAFLNVSSNRLPGRMHNHIGCICLPFQHCVFSNESSIGLPGRICNHISCSCFASKTSDPGLS